MRVTPDVRSGVDMQEVDFMANPQPQSAKFQVLVRFQLHRRTTQNDTETQMRRKDL